MLDDRNFSCSRWSVVTTIFNLSDAVIQAANLGPEWCLVIVSDITSPSYQMPEHISSQVVILTADEQKRIIDQTADPFLCMLPWRHFGRKNFGYLYAISHGAQVIWDFDDDNSLKSAAYVHRLASSELASFLTPQASASPSHPLVINPYPSFGASVTPIWPRGFPLSAIKTESTWQLNLKETSIESHRIGVIQSAADIDPDVDAIFRLTQALPVHFKVVEAGDLKPIAFPKYAFVPFNAQACLFRRQAFWSLLLPMTVHSRVCDIWRSYIGQRLMWDIGALLAYSPPIVDQIRNSHNYLADLQSEFPLYQRAEALIDFLSNWNPTSPHLPGRIEALFVALYERDYIQIDDVFAAQAWISALLKSGYVFPAIVDSSRPLIDPLRVGERLEALRKLLPDAGYHPDAREKFISHLKHHASEHIQPPAQSLFPGVLLIVQFNSNSKDKLADVPRFLEIYGKLFDEILFTASAGSGKGSYDHGNIYGVHICPGAEGGWMHYYCMAEIMQHFPNRKGYLAVHFDVLVNWPALRTYDLDRLWIMGSGPEEFPCQFSPITLRVAPYDWWPFQSKNPITGGNTGLESIAQFYEFAPEFVQQNYHRICSAMHGAEADLCKSPLLFPKTHMGDLLYVPLRYVENFIILSEIGFRVNLWLEFASSMIFCGLVESDPIENEELQLAAGVPHQNKPPNWDIDIVYHQNPMNGPGMSNNELVVNHALVHAVKLTHNGLLRPIQGTDKASIPSGIIL